MRQDRRFDGSESPVSSPPKDRFQSLASPDGEDRDAHQRESPSRPRQLHPAPRSGQSFAAATPVSFPASHNAVVIKSATAVAIN